MRIVYCIEKFSARGGIERILADKMNWLAQKTNHEIVLMTVWNDNNPFPYELDSRIRKIHLNVPFHLYPLALTRFNRIMSSLNPGACIVFRAMGSFLAAFTSWKGKIIFESHTPLEKMNHKWVYPLMMKKVWLAVCLTQGDSQNFKRVRRVEVIPNFTNLNADAEIDYEAKRIISLGRDCFEKNFGRMRRIFAQVQMQHPDWQLDIHHNTQDVITAYSSGSIFISTSLFEGFPLTLLEVHTMGLPCVSFDCPYGPREIIEDGKSGYLIPYDDDRMFVQKLNYLIEHPEQRKAMGEYAKSVAKKFDKDNIMRQWLKIFADIQRKG